MPEADELLDRGVRRQVRLTRVANGVARDALQTLHEAERQIAAYVEKRLDALAARGIRISKTARDRIASILAGARKRSKGAWDQIIATLQREFIRTGQMEAALEAASLAAVLKRDRVEPSRAEVRDTLMRTPLERGNLFGPTLSGIAAGHLDAIARGVRAGVAAGESARDTVRRTFGTAAARYLDGYTATTKRAVSGFVETAWTHAAALGRNVAYAAAGTVVRGVIWNSVTDHKTCLTCGSLNGKVFPLDRGPRPPAHPSCRCGISPVLVGLGAPEVPSYEAWLQRQPAEVQREALGATRYRLWRAGKVGLDRFVNDRNQVLTLDELARREGLSGEDIGRQAA